jgi:hypothetical protein
MFVIQRPLFRKNQAISEVKKFLKSQDIGNFAAIKIVLFVSVTAVSTSCLNLSKYAIQRPFLDISD